MLLTALHVRSDSGAEGINAFCSLHGAYVWPGVPPPGVPDSNPGERVNDQISVPPGGNRVRGYLDIVAPDETPTSEILASVPAYLATVRERPLPWVATIGRCTFRFGLEFGIEPNWTAEFRALLEASVRVRVPF